MSYQPHNFQPGAVLLAEQLNEMDNEIARISGGEGVLSENVKQSLLECFENVAWINDQGQTYYDNLYNALYPPLNIESISAVFDSGSNVIYDNMTLDDLRQYLTVIATLTDYSTQTVTDYVLSGNMTAGNQTITVSYAGKTTTFTVTVVEWLTSISAVFTQGSAVIYDTDSLDTLKQYLTVTATYADSTTATVSDYTLSGTLMAGTSIITVSYGGKNTTFSVLCESILYPLANGSFTFSGNYNQKITISNGRHIKVEYPIGDSFKNGSIINLSSLSNNGSTSIVDRNASAVDNLSSVLFTIPANSNVELAIENLNHTRSEMLSPTGGTTNASQFLLSLRKTGTSSSFISGGVGFHAFETDDKMIITGTIGDQTSISCLFLYEQRVLSGVTVEFDISLKVNGVKWI